MDLLRKTNGFTLIEVLVTMVILTIGLLGVTGLTAGVMKGNGFSKNMTTATMVAKQRLENVQRLGYSGTTTTNFPSDNENVSMGGAIFVRQTSISENTPAANMKTVSVTVSWNSGQSSVALNTIIAQ
jgi:type II secretion system protein I